MESGQMRLLVCKFTLQLNIKYVNLWHGNVLLVFQQDADIITLISTSVHGQKV